jgi:hypothetical protein
MYQPPSLSFSLALSSSFRGSMEVRISAGFRNHSEHFPVLNSGVVPSFCFQKFSRW